ncbi:hypothetical protein CAPTEDRAFT_199322 [Capitella teleta]|uniref:Uncharacterized protein n=1 Tax=Capitella teleta TaxID=283909 RepID=R7T4W4_CAPTE|nr:hypothetical protein CAPTEDRAFT_199322 [Capitella teleta]|eukprot:ELT87961.1 hypothetical protein CAPTEDRAFT_199322 [Capitella teleta]
MKLPAASVANGTSNLLGKYPCDIARSVGHRDLADTLSFKRAVDECVPRNVLQFARATSKQFKHQMNYKIDEIYVTPQETERAADFTKMSWMTFNNRRLVLSLTRPMRQCRQATRHPFILVQLRRCNQPHPTRSLEGPDRRSPQSPTRNHDERMHTIITMYSQLLIMVLTHCVVDRLLILVEICIIVCD